MPRARPAHRVSSSEKRKKKKKKKKRFSENLRKVRQNPNYYLLIFRSTLTHLRLFVDPGYDRVTHVVWRQETAEAHATQRPPSANARHENDKGACCTTPVARATRAHFKLFNFSGIFFGNAYLFCSCFGNNKNPLEAPPPHPPRSPRLPQFHEVRRCRKIKYRYYFLADSACLALTRNYTPASCLPRPPKCRSRRRLLCSP